MMNGFSIIADDYRQKVKQGKIDRETAERDEIEDIER